MLQVFGRLGDGVWGGLNEANDAWNCENARTAFYGRNVCVVV